MSSKESKLLKEVFSQADGVAVWGGEESVNAVKKITPSGARFIDWGPKISFGYVADSHAQCLSTIEKFALDICLVDQQACSSPQCIYLETDSKDELDGFASNLAHALAKLSSTTSGLVPSLQEQAEITNVTELVRLGSCLNEGNVIETEDRAWRVLIEYKPGLRASPLFRSIWVKPLPRNQIVRTLRPLRQYLQTVGIAGEITDIAELSRDFVAAGVQRVTLPGHMHDSYMGEPHDGRYALQAYTRRVSWQLDQRFEGISCLEDFIEGPERKGTNDPLMTKEDFQAQVVDETFAHLFFKSGGSSGDPKISLFTYDDYHGQMFAAAEGLYAAGLNPATDRCMNLFFGGGLYGGFISFFTILERLGAVQLPMSSHLDFDFVAEMIVRNKVNVLLGMPSYLIQIFQKNESILKEYAGVKKIFFGGEHFNGIQRRYLKDQFGVELVKSATYGSVDAGPLGFQCQHCDGTVHHVHDRLQYVEIVSLASDEPVGTGEVGRLIFTSKMRSGQKLNRYEIGDLGRWVQGPCKCGRTSPRFELLGRHGDIVRVGSAFINYRKINQVIADTYLYAGEMQMILDNIEGKDHILIKVGTIDMQSPGSVLDSIISDYADLREIVSEGLLTMDVKFCDSSQFERTSSSGKLRLIIDKRVPQ